MLQADLHIKGAPIAADPGRNPGFGDFSENVDLGIFRWNLGSGGGLQSIGNGYELQTHKFSAHIKPYELSFEDFHCFGQFSAVWRLF